MNKLMMSLHGFEQSDKEKANISSNVKTRELNKANTRFYDACNRKCEYSEQEAFNDYQKRSLTINANYNQWK